MICTGLQQWKDRIVQSTLASLALLATVVPALAIVGGAPEIPDPKSQPEVMLVGSHGNFCTGVLIAPVVVLTAAHCVLPGAIYKRVELDAKKKPVFFDTVAIERHPQFSLKTLLAHRATADVALIKLAAPLTITPARLLPSGARVQPGEAFVLRGYGMSVRGNPETSATLRKAALVATGLPGNLQLRLVDPATGGVRTGLSACTGDSGAPVYQDSGGGLGIYGVVSWSTGPRGEDGCGGLTGVTPLELYRPWIIDRAQKLGGTSRH